MYILVNVKYIIRFLKIFYEKPDNKKKLLDILNNSNNISLRIIDWFVTNYSKKNNTCYMIYDNNIDVNGDNSESKQFNIYYS